MKGHWEALGWEYGAVLGGVETLRGTVPCCRKCASRPMSQPHLSASVACSQLGYDFGS